VRSSLEKIRDRRDRAAAAGDDIEAPRLQNVMWDAPAARQAHPREEHLLPLMVIAGAAGADVGKVAFSGAFTGHRLSAYHFG